MNPFNNFLDILQFPPHKPFTWKSIYLNYIEFLELELSKLSLHHQAILIRFSMTCGPCETALNYRNVTSAAWSLGCCTWTLHYASKHIMKAPKSPIWLTWHRKDIDTIRALAGHLVSVGLMGSLLLKSRNRVALQTVSWYLHDSASPSSYTLDLLLYLVS